ncbi:hypothetical protein AB0N88_28420 [Streptomyces sp. NPDC093516]|uniref:hypothetical protein n=1 Tax=Streptomyces sp. NPDC093516 TaxID=3155304 RepID=UPI003428FE60
MALTLFSRRPEPPAAEPKPWPEIGETWTPEGVTVVERYTNQAGAVVLVYTAAQPNWYNIACLGCHFTKASNKFGTRSWLILQEAAGTANEHATHCRALPREIPARPDDDTARERLHQWLSDRRNRTRDQQIVIESMDSFRLHLQRTDDWIAAALQQLAVDQPEVLRIERSQYSDHVSYYARRLPQD